MPFKSFIGATVTAHGQTCSSPLTRYLLSISLSSNWLCWVHIGLYIPAVGGAIPIGYSITKGGTEGCIARLLLTLRNATGEVNIIFKIPEKNLLCIGLCTKVEGEVFSIFQSQVTRSLVIHLNQKLVTFSHYRWSLTCPKYICT